MPIVNPFEMTGQWFKANLHTHTTCSDGKVTPEQRIAQYKDAGYQILAITDHRVPATFSARSGENFLIIDGIEIHPDAPYNAPAYHLVGLDVPQDFVSPDPADAQKAVDAILHVGGVVILAHPYWHGHTINQNMAIDGYSAMEVFNSTCDCCGRGFSSVHWDDLLCTGRMVPAVAVDDAHGEHDMFGGWTMIRAKELTRAAVMDSICRGAFYASTGPAITDFRVLDGQAVVQCSAVSEIHLLARGSSGQILRAEPGQSLTHWTCDIIGAKDYLRLEVIDADGRRAWAGPIDLSDQQ